MSDKKWALRIKDIGAYDYGIFLLNTSDRLRIHLQNVDDEFCGITTTVENDRPLNKLAEKLIGLLNNEPLNKLAETDLDIYTELMKGPDKDRSQGYFSTPCETPETGRFPESGFYWIKFTSDSRWTVREYSGGTDTFIIAGAVFKARDMYKIYPQRLMLPAEILAKPRAE